jgi:hypothetical protein
MMGRVVALAWRFRDCGTYGIVPASQLEETPFSEEKPDQIGLGGEYRVGPSVIDMQNPAQPGRTIPLSGPGPELSANTSGATTSRRAGHGAHASN